MNSIFKSFLISVLMIAQVHFAYSQTASILPNAKTTFVDANGKPLTSGTVDFYIPGGTTRKTTWQDAAETIPNLNPVKLDAAGRALILGSGDYRQIVKDRYGNVIWDQVTSSTGTSSGGGTVSTGDGDLVGTIKPWAGSIAPNQYVFAYGQELSRASFVPLFAAIVSTQSVFCNSGSPILNGLGDTNSFWIGMPLEVSCLGAGASTVVSKTSSTVTMAANANVTTNTNASFFPWGRGNGTTTFNVPDLRGVVLAGNNIMGGVSGTQLTTTFFGATDPNSAGALGGSQSRTINAANQVPYTPAGTVTGTVSYQSVLSTVSGSGTALLSPGGAFGFQPASLASGLLVGTPQGTGLGAASSAVVAAGGAGYTNGSQTLTVVGGTCTTQPQFTVTVIANAVTAPILSNAGLCSVAPANAAATTGGGGTGATLTVTYTQAPLSVVQPTRTANFIIKVTPDSNSATASGVTSLASMVGDIACGSGLTCTGNIVTVSIPVPSASTLGGVFSKTCSASNWFTTLDTTGTFTCLQPSFTDLAGTIGLAQIPANFITYAKLQQGTGLSVVGNPTNAGANLQDITAASDNQIMRRSGTAIGFGSIDLSQANAVASTILRLANGGCNAALTASNGGILWSNATQCQILAGTATANLPLVSGVSGAPSWANVSYPTAPTSGGIACFTSTTVMTSSLAMTANAVMLGGGAGSCPSPMASLGTTATVLHGNAAGAPTFGPVALSTDVSGLGAGVATALGTTLSAAGGVTTTIAGGTSALGTSAIASAACATIVTTAATNTATTDVVTASFNGDPTAVTGYIPSTSGMLTIFVFPTANNVNFKVCNNTSASITPGAITLNWRVVR